MSSQLKHPFLSCHIIVRGALKKIGQLMAAFLLAAINPTFYMSEREEINVFFISISIWNAAFGT